LIQFSFSGKSLERQVRSSWRSGKVKRLRRLKLRIARERRCAISPKLKAKQTPSGNRLGTVTIPKINAKKLDLRTDNLSGIFIPSPEAPNKGFGDCKYTGNGYLFLLGENLETLTILVFRNQCSTVEQVLFTRFLEGEFDAEISEFLEG
jgi:hypothetical protein